ncbi:MAG: sugar phosphate isomerase/epimerase [Mariniphaga sp.]|nr:sugar phosphate isomerase/epimerase [Mariniphaga sp.]
MKRREFLEKSSLATGAALLASSANATTINREKANPAKQNSGQANIKIGLYSISYLGIWYNGPALTFEEMVKRAKDVGYDGIELDNKRPLGNPMDLNQAARDKMRNLVEKNGMEIPCVAANNDFSSPIQEQREMQLLMVKETIKLAADVGAKIVRLFAAWFGVPIHNGIGTYDFVRGDFYTYERKYPYVTRIDKWSYVRECLKEVTGFAEEYGITLVLQNHPPLTDHWKDCYNMVKEVNSENLKVCLDLPMMIKHDKEWVENAVRTVGNLQTHSHFGGEYFRDSSGKVQQKVISSKFGKPLPDYGHFLELMDEISYNGWFTFELCHPVLTDSHEVAGIEYVHEQVELAHEFMKDIINSM